MIKLGVVSRHQFSERILRKQERSRKRRPALAATLLADYGVPVTSRDERELEAIYKWLPGGSCAKRTRPRRYGALDDLMIQLLSERLPPDRHLTIHDMGASNAITSLELFEQLLRCRGGNVSVLASDYFDALHVVSVPPWRIVFDAEGQPLQFVGQRMVLSAQSSESMLYPVNRLLSWFLRRNILPPAQRFLAEGRYERIELFHPRSRALADCDARFRLGRDNVFGPKPGVYDVVRLLRTLSSHRFTKEQNELALRVVSEHLSPDGFLIVGQARDRDGATEATIFQKKEGCFEVAAEMSGGSEFREMVLAFM